MDDRIHGRSRDATERRVPTPEDFEKVLGHAEELRTERERFREDLERQGFRIAAVAFGVPLISVAYSYISSVLERTSDTGWPNALAIAATLVVMSVLVSILVNAWRRAKSYRLELAASERALYETLQLLRETKGLYSMDWPTLTRAQFEIRLARFEIGSDDAWQWLKVTRR